MGKRSLQVELISAESLTRQFPSCAMAIHVTAHSTNDSSMPMQEIPSDPLGDVNPKWNQTLCFTLHCSSGGRKSEEFLNIELHNMLTPDVSSSVIGSAQIPLVKLLESADEEGTDPVHISWPVSTGGHLYLSYKLGAYVSPAAKIVSTIVEIAVEGVSFASNLGSIYWPQR